MTNKSQSVVRFSQDKDLGGLSLDFPPGRYNRLDHFRLQGTTSWNDQISSFTVPDGWIVRFYEHENFDTLLDTARGDMPWVGDGWNDKISSVEIRDPLQPLASRRLFEAQHSEHLRKFTAFNHVAGTIALSIFGLGAVAPMIGKAESDAGLLSSDLGGDDSKNLILKDDLTGGKDERQEIGAVFYGGADYDGDFVRLLPGRHELATPPASVGVPPGYRVVVYEGPGQTGTSSTYERPAWDLGAWTGRIIRSVRIETGDWRTAAGAGQLVPWLHIRVQEAKEQTKTIPPEPGSWQAAALQGVEALSAWLHANMPPS